jgi:N-methylhydantoinase A
MERKGAKVVLITTEGHRDLIEMREGLKNARYDLRSPPLEPLAPHIPLFDESAFHGVALTPHDAGIARWWQRGA